MTVPEVVAQAAPSAVLVPAIVALWRRGVTKDAECAAEREKCTKETKRLGRRITRLEKRLAAAGVAK